MTWRVIQDRRVILGTVIVALAPAFVVTQAIVGRYRTQRRDLAIEWSTRGEHDVHRDPAIAVAEFQTALSYGADDPDDRLRLAQALIAAKRPVEAEAHLLTLWAEEPGNGPVNLALARLAVTADNVSDAVRYYHAAIDGAWESGATTARREARLELARFLLGKGQNIRAQAELIALIDDLPRDPVSMTEVAGLLVQGGADGRAIGLLQHALELDPANREASRRAGEIEFRIRDFARADQYFRTAASSGPLDADDQALQDLSGRVLRLDPAVPELSARERARRLRLDLDIAAVRLVRCQTLVAVNSTQAARIADLSDQAARMAKVKPRALERDADLMDQMSDLVFQIETLPPAVCAPDSADDRALQLVAARDRSSAR